MYHPELPAPGRQPREPLAVLHLPEQPRRLAELLRADCQLDELMLLREYAKQCLRFPVTVRWLDPDVDERVPVEVCALGLKEEFDRRGVLVKCSVAGSEKTRWIPLEQLQGPWVDDPAAWDEADAQKVASRVIGDYCFWVTQLHGLDPSASGFCDDDDDEYQDERGGLLRHYDDGLLESGEEDEAEALLAGGEGGGLLLGEDSDGPELMEYGSDSALSDLGGAPLLLAAGEGGEEDEEEEGGEEDSAGGARWEDEEDAPFAEGEEEDEKLWRIGYDEDLDVGLLPQDSMTASMMMEEEEED